MDNIWRRIDVTFLIKHLLKLLEKYYLDPKVLTAVEISALKVRVFGKKLQKPHAKPHANLTQKQQRTHDLT